jgi:aryl-alcohol dehydrogenase-like predicted oxidoreductase
MMKYRRLGSTSLRVSVIGIGTWQLGGEWGKDFAQAEVDGILGRASELGVNLIDTAECYGDHLAEALIGRAIEKERDRWIIATKFGHRYEAYMQRSEPRSAAEVMQQLEDSLRALRTDHIDIYQYHSVRDREYDDQDLRQALLNARQAGKIRHIGASISQATNIHQVEGAPAAGVEVIQVLYNRLDRAAEAQVLPACQRLNLGVLARVPLASGFLSGKYRPGATFKPGDVRSMQDQHKLEARLREVERIGQNELPAGVPMAHWALAWCLQNPAVTSVIPGCKDIQQLESNARAADLPMVRGDHPQAMP